MINTKEDMKQRSDELFDKFVNEIQSAFDTAKTFYEECGMVNGMDWQHEMCRLYDRLQEQVHMMDKIHTRVNRHIDEVSDEREFRLNKLHRMSDEDRDELNHMEIDVPTVKFNRLQR